MLGQQAAQYARTAATLATVLTIASPGIADGIERNDLIYTSYSLGADVNAFNTNKNEFIRVIEACGPKHEGRVARVSDSERVSINHLAKSDIAVVEYVRLKPVRATAFGGAGEDC